MADIDDYDAGAALTSYFPSKAERRPARLWATEHLIQTLAEIGMIEVFFGAGTDPTVLTGYASTKLWLQVSSGLTDEPGTLRAYDGSGDASDIANWPALTVSGFQTYLAASTLPVSLANGGTGVSLSDPGGDRVLFWDDSAGASEWLTIGTDLAISGTTLNGTIVDATTGASGKMSATDKLKLDGIEASADVTDAANVGAAMISASAKTTPVNADQLGLIDSAASNALKPITYANLLAEILTNVPLVQRVTDTYALNADLSTVLPIDDTIPQSTEGTEILSVSITPTNASNIIRCRFSGFGATGTNAVYWGAALFSGTTCIKAASHYAAALGYTATIAFEHEFVAGGTSAITLSVRVGASSGNVRMNGTNGARHFGGVAASTLIVEEIRV